MSKTHTIRFTLDDLKIRSAARKKRPGCGVRHTRVARIGSKRRICVRGARRPL
jgi:hypothetical protein